jgi:gamma-glutamylcyclotransferase (GGCT)/AIG2-like uncharacterized protein YtfP
MTNRLFVYGILRKGFALDLTNEGATFIGNATLKNAQLYWLGNRAGVGLRFEPTKVSAVGEVWEIPDRLWKWLDDIEGVRHNVYKRLKTFPVLADGSAPETYVYAHVYYEGNAKKYYNDPIRSNDFAAGLTD